MRIIIIGAGTTGCIAGLASARDGHDVFLLDADDTPEPPAHDGETVWHRRGMPHAPQAHAFLAGSVRTLADVAPSMLEQLLGSGVIERSAPDIAPPTIQDRSAYPGDEELRVINARRPHVEWHLRRAIRETPGVECRVGIHVRGLIARDGNGAAPHIDGVVHDDGEQLHADLVLDASGRRSRAPHWLRAVGVDVVDQHDVPCGAIYRTRHYRLKHEAHAMPDHTFVLADPSPAGFVRLLFPGDNGTLQLATGGLPEDPLLSRAVEPQVFHEILMTSRILAPWIDPDRAAPMGDPAIYGGLRNRLRRLVADREPLVTGFHLLGDAGAITNPMYGRGVSHGAVHARAVTRIIGEHPDDPRAQTLAVDDEVARMLEPSVAESVAQDRARAAMWRAALNGEEPERVEMPPLPAGISRAQLMNATQSDPVVWRAMMRQALVLEPHGSWLRDADVVARVRTAAEDGMPTPTVEQTQRARAEVEDLIARV